MPTSEQLRITVASPPDREYIVAEIFLGAEQWAELNQESGILVLEIYPRRDGQPWRVSYDSMVSALTKAKAKLLGDSAA